MGQTIDELMRLRSKLSSECKVLDDELRTRAQTIESVDQVLRHLHATNGKSPPPPPQLLNLLFSKVRAAWIDGVVVLNANWNEVLWLLAQRLEDRREFETMMMRAYREGRHQPPHHRFVEHMNLSYHNVAAPVAWKLIKKIAGFLGVQVTLEIEWIKNSGPHRTGDKLTLDTTH